MKRFLLFVVESYYPSGGWDDFHKDYNTLEEAHAAGQAWCDSNGYKSDSFNHYHIVDTETWTKITKEA